ncbi:hypothetical protein ACQ5SK_11185 [Bradyrhizobium japonicum]
MKTMHARVPRHCSPNFNRDDAKISQGNMDGTIRTAKRIFSRRWEQSIVTSDMSSNMQRASAELA